MKYQIIVTENDIKRGVKEDPCNCPVARAIRRVVKRTVITVYGSTADIGPNSVVLPKKVNKWIEQFDVTPKATMKPISFVLTVD